MGSEIVVTAASASLNLLVYDSSQWSRLFKDGVARFYVRLLLTLLQVNIVMREKHAK